MPAGRSAPGGQCSRYFIDTSWNNDQTFEAMGQSMRNEKIESAFMMALNNQAGKDMLADFQRYYKDTGKIAGRNVKKIRGALQLRPFFYGLSAVRSLPDGFFRPRPRPVRPWRNCKLFATVDKL